MYGYAERAVQSMCEQSVNEHNVLDFDVKAGQVLAYVYQHIKAQPLKQQHCGFINLFRHLSYARGNNIERQTFCLTRHLEEALTALSSAYGNLAIGVPFEQAREVLQKLGQDVLIPLLKHSAAADIVVQNTFSQRLREVLRAHPHITDEQIQRYLHEFVLPHWETYCEVAQEVYTAAITGASSSKS